MTVIIPVTQEQFIKLDSIHQSYLTNTPYDYAFLGMRCGAATYDILSQIGILKHHSRTGIVMRVFYPKIIRKRLLQQAEIHNWEVNLQAGTSRRKWETD